MRNLHGWTAAGLFLVGSVAAAGAATVRSALWRVERGENDGPALEFAAVAWNYDGGTALGFGAATPVVAVDLPERVWRERGNVRSGGGGAAHGVIVLAFDANAPADVSVGPRGTSAFVPPIAAVASPDAWLDSVEVSGELPRGGTGLQNTGYALRFEVPEPGAYGLIGTAVCAAVALGRRRRGGPNVRTEKV